MASSLTALLRRAQDGDGVARDAVYTYAFGRLRSIAFALLRRERSGHTLQPTALVGELFLKLNRLGVRVVDEDHFFRICARAMRQVLIDHARNRRSRPVLTADELARALASSSDRGTTVEDAVAIRSVFEDLRTMDRLAARTVWLHVVEGLTFPELSGHQRREMWRVRADVDFGLRWMADRLGHTRSHSASETSFAQARMSAGRS